MPPTNVSVDDGLLAEALRISEHLSKMILLLNGQADITNRQVPAYPLESERYNILGREWVAALTHHYRWSPSE